MTPTPAASSGELLKPIAYAIYGIGAGKHYLRDVKIIPASDTREEWKSDDDGLGDYWAGNEPVYLRAAVSQAAPEQATKRNVLIAAAEQFERFFSLHDKLDVAYIADSLRVSAGDEPKHDGFDPDRALAAPSGAPKQPQNINYILALLAQYHKEVWEVAQSEQPIYDEAGRETAKKLVAAIEGLAAASTVQSAPVLPDEAEFARFVAWSERFTKESGGQVMSPRDAWIAAKREAAQSTPVQVEGQQEQTLQPSCDSALHAEPAGQHEADASVLSDERIIELAVENGLKVRTGAGAVKFARVICAELASRCRAQGGIDEPNGAVQAVALPVAAVPEQKP